MNHARNSNSGVVPKDTFFVDRKIEEDDEGEAVKERGETKEAEWELEHDLGGAFLSEHKFISFCVEAEGEVDEAIFFLGRSEEHTSEL